MICYASRTGTHATQAMMRERGWRMLISRTGKWSTDGFAYALDNGAWSDFIDGTPFDVRRYLLMLDRLGPQADWVVAPDIVEGGQRSLDLSVSWLERSLSRCGLVLLAVQDGMQVRDIAPLLGPRIGLFLGGSTQWKMATMTDWGRLAAAKGVHFHVARVNTAKRMRAAIGAGATSVDGSSVSQYAVSLQLLDQASRQPDLLAP